MRRSNARPRQAFDPPSNPSSEMDHHLLLRPKSSSKSASSSRRRCCPCCRPFPLLLITAAVLIPSLIYYYCHYIFSSYPTSSSVPPKFSIVIDGGSTGTRIHVFSYRSANRRLLPVLDMGMTASLKVGPGLSFYAEDPDSAGESLVRLVEFAKRRVPQDLWGETEIRLMGTAGLRMVDAGVQGRILDSCRNVLRGSAFIFHDQWAAVISGRSNFFFFFFFFFFLRKP